MTKTDWLEIIEKRQASGISIKSWCQQNGFKYSSYKYWAKKINEKKRVWAEVSVPTTTISKEIKIYRNNWSIIVDEGVSTALLINVLKAVDSVCC